MFDLFRVSTAISNDNYKMLIWCKSPVKSFKLYSRLLKPFIKKSKKKKLTITLFNDSTLEFMKPGKPMSKVFRVWDEEREFKGIDSLIQTSYSSSLQNPIT